MSDLATYYDESYPPSIYAPPVPPVVPSTGATAGIPGTWTPPGSQAPATPAGMGSITATPATAWTTGQYVQTGLGGAPGQTHWTGTAWAGGVAAAAEEPEA